MKIAIDLTALSYHITGIERYSLCVGKKMLEIDQENEYFLIFRNQIYSCFEKYIDEKRIKAIILKGNNKLLFYQFVLPKALHSVKADKYLFMAFPNPVLFKHKGIINVIHDMGAWDAGFALKLLQKMYFKITYRVAAKRSEKIITVSNFSKDRICKILSVSKEKVMVAYSGISDVFFDVCSNDYDSISKKYGLPSKYIMSLSTLEPRKNIGLLLEAFTSIMDDVDYDLVLVGRNGWKMNKEIQKYEAKSRIHLTGFIDDADVAQIYRHAKCFVFPTKYEGFGLPPVEALALGTPVISSDAASMPEILMQQATYFKSNNKEELLILLKNVEDIVSKMPKGLNSWQKNNYDFGTSAKKILECIQN